MKHIVLCLSILFVSPLHADVTFDKWKFSELLITGLKASRDDSAQTQQQVLGEIQTMLAQYNIDIDRKYRRKPELGLERVRQALLPPIQDAWVTEGNQGAEAKQRAFLGRVLELGLGPSVAVATDRLSAAYFRDHWLDGVFIKNHVFMASTGLGLLGGVTYLTLSDATPVFFVAQLVGTGFAYAKGMDLFSEHNRKTHFKYSANFIGPIFRECELDLLRPHDPQLSQH